MLSYYYDLSVTAPDDLPPNGFVKIHYNQITGQVECRDWQDQRVPFDGEGGTPFLVVDNLNSFSTNSALSANQGRILKGISDGKVPLAVDTDIRVTDYTPAFTSNNPFYGTAEHLNALINDTFVSTGTAPESWSTDGLPAGSPGDRILVRKPDDSPLFLETEVAGLLNAAYIASDINASNPQVATWVKSDLAVDGSVSFTAFTNYRPGQLLVDTPTGDNYLVKPDGSLLRIPSEPLRPVNSVAGKTGDVLLHPGDVRDTLADTPCIFRLQTHLGDGKPFGLYQDESCTIPAVGPGDPVKAMRDEITGSGVTAIDEGPSQEAVLEFIGGTPWVKTTDNTMFVVSNAPSLFSGEGIATVAFNLNGDTQYTIFSTDDGAAGGHYDRFAGDGKSYPSTFLDSGESRNDAYRDMPTTGIHTLTSSNDSFEWKSWLDGSPGSSFVKSFGFKGDKIFIMGGPQTLGTDGHFVGCAVGVAWSDAERIYVESSLSDLAPRTAIVAFAGDSNTVGNTLPSPTTQSWPSRTGQYIKALRYTPDLINVGISGTSSFPWASAIQYYVDDTFIPAGVKKVAVMLGTNDAKSVSPTTRVQFKNNITTVCNSLLGSGITPILLPPPYPTPGSFGEWDASSVELVREYIQVLNEISTAIPGAIYVDTGLFEYTEANPSGTMSDGIHLTSDTSLWLARKVAPHLT